MPDDTISMGDATFPATARGSLEAQAHAERFLAPNLKFSFAEWLLSHGREFVGRTLPPEYERMAAKMCFRNAFVLASSNDDLTYCEGFLYRAWLPMVAIHHAWCIDSAGLVVEATIEDPDAEDAYFGIAMDFSIVARATLSTETYGVLFKDEGHRLIDALGEVSPA